MTTSPGHVVVVGGGIFGAATALELRSREWSVTLLDPHALPFDGASSTDVSKVVRMDYGSDVFYHELAERALEGWDRWNAEWPRALYHEDGFLILSQDPMTPPRFEHESWRVLHERGYRPERVTGRDLGSRFTPWRSGAYADGYYNARAGWVESGAVVERLLALGDAAGVVRRADALDRVIERGSRAQGVLTRAGAKITSDRVVVCAGAWTPTLLPWLADRLSSVAQPVLFFGVDDPAVYRAPAFPPWAADIAGSGWYGFPALLDGRVKVGHHGPGAAVHPDARGEVGSTHLRRARAFLRDAIPGLADAPLLGQRICLYCDSFDGDFLIDADPDRDGLIVASGGSGHSFKFAPVIGELVADTVEGRPNPWATRFRWRGGGGPGREQARYTQ